MRKDRTVHAGYDGMEVVRYDRAGKWYLEPTDTSLRRQPVTVFEAAIAARWGRANANGWVELGLSGGRTFDRLAA